MRTKCTLVHCDFQSVQSKSSEKSIIYIKYTYLLLFSPSQCHVITGDISDGACFIVVHGMTLNVNCFAS